MLEICSSINEIPKADFQKLHNDNPFMSYDFLWSLENSGCASDAFGWIPNHFIQNDESGQISCFTPAYIKYNSFGEYVFDHVWVDFYNKVNIRYFPKLLIAIPFTPIRSSKFLTKLDNTDIKVNSIRAMKSFLDNYDLSSVHVNFINDEEVKILKKNKFLIRTSKQFIWENQNYNNFDDFLNSLNARKRKMITKERRSLHSDGICFERVNGQNITDDLLATFFKHYLDTCNRKWGNAYLNKNFFENLVDRIPDNLLLIIAKNDQTTIGTSLHLHGHDTLYGRYWGASGFYNFLHYELCYYQAIEYAIENGILTIESGAGGSHKISRGYKPTFTYSAHFFQNQKIQSIISEFIEKEGEYIGKEVDYLSNFNPFKNTED